MLWFSIDPALIVFIFTFIKHTIAENFPLDPLTESEVNEVGKFIRDNFGDTFLVFQNIYLNEPPKSILAPYLEKIRKNGGKIPKSEKIERVALASYYQVSTGQKFETLYNLDSKKEIKTRKFLRNPNLCINDYELKNNISNTEKALLEDKRVIAKVKKLGLKIDQIFTDVSSGYNSSTAARCISTVGFYFREFPNDNFFAHPLGFGAFVDVFASKVTDVFDLQVKPNNSTSSATADIFNLPRETANYDPSFAPPFFYREGIKPVQTVSPSGPGFKINGYQVEWEKFKFRIGFNVVEGLTLHDVSYKDGVSERLILYRASYAEMVVPYGDPNYEFKYFLDEGEYGLGEDANSLIPNHECYPGGVLIDVVKTSRMGTGIKSPRSICVHEEDDGILHRHVELDGTITLARSKLLNVFLVSTIGNYDYVFFWKFRQDGSISSQVGLTGSLSTNLYIEGKSPYGTYVLPRVSAQNHQHIFIVRLDLDIEDEKNSVSTFDVVDLPENDNPYGNGFTVKETLLKTSIEGTTDTNEETERIWKIFNPNYRNPVNKKWIGYKLIPDNNRHLLFAEKDSDTYRRAEFATHSVWVTKYKDYELSPSGNFPFKKGGDGLPRWAKRNDSIVNTDIVLWHSFGITHIPRIEDFPLMSYEYHGFMLKPMGFFTAYAGVDVPTTLS